MWPRANGLALWPRQTRKDLSIGQLPGAVWFFGDSDYACSVPSDG